MHEATFKKTKNTINKHACVTPQSSTPDQRDWVHLTQDPPRSSAPSRQAQDVVEEPKKGKLAALGKHFAWGSVTFVTGEVYFRCEAPGQMDVRFNHQRDVARVFVWN